MLLIITGKSRTGKTMLARKIAEKKNVYELEDYDVDFSNLYNRLRNNENMVNVVIAYEYDTVLKKVRGIPHSHIHITAEW